MFKGNERESLSRKWNFFSSNLFRYVNFFSQLNPNMTKTKKQKLNKLNHQIKLPPKNLLLCQARIQTIATFALADLEKNIYVYLYVRKNVSFDIDEHVKELKVSKFINTKDHASLSRPSSLLL